MGPFKLIIKLAFLIVLFFLTIENMQKIKFNFLGLYELSLPLMILVLIFLILGIIFGIFLSALRTVELKLKIKKLEKLIK